MGHNQSWKISSHRRWLSAWPRLVSDVRLIVDAADIDLTSDRIWDLHEVETYYKGSEEARRKLLDPPPAIVDEEMGIVFNGIQNDGCEPFILERNPKPRWRDPNDFSSNCKTNRRPYEIVVCAVLLRAKQLLGDAFYGGIPSKASIDQDHMDNWYPASSLITLLWPDEELLVDYNEEFQSVFKESKPTQHETLPMEKVERQNPKGLENQAVNEIVKNCLLPLELSDSLLNTILQWIKHCNAASSGHEKCRPAAPQPLHHLPLLRLIDVSKNCIVPAPPNPSYIALSYVWGPIPQPRLLSSNLSELLSENGFSKHEIPFSKTITDSMTLCQRLGYRYLWVDALCILQDNSQDKILQLNTMREIYSNASLTLVAAVGTHANSGLGLTDMEIPSFTMTPRPDIWTSFSNDISKTKWETRGWTFQEKLLSKRLLLFCASGPYFICSSHIYNSSGYQKLDLSSIHDRPGSFSNIESGLQLKTYLSAVQQYSKRELTMPSDFSNAIQGILKAFKYSMDGLPNNFFHGIPTSVFDELFCWRVTEHDPDSRRPDFPSWTWEGWNQVPLFPDFILERVKEKREAEMAGSRILADDRGGFTSFGKLGFVGRNAGRRNMPLMLRWIRTQLSVSMDWAEEVGTNGLFRVSSAGSGRYVGLIQLHKEWRKRKPEVMEFMPVFTEKSGEETIIKVLMCLEPSEMESRGGSLSWESFERVQLMDCHVREEDWMAMTKESPISQAWETWFVF